MPNASSAVLLDLDGTLVDSVYHHVITWEAALRGAGRPVPLWRIHAGIGMGGARLLPWLLGEAPEDADALSQEHQRRFLDLADTLQPTPGARALLDDLERRDVPFLVATSAEPAVEEALLATLGRGDLPTNNAGDVGSPKPAPDLLEAGCDELGMPPSRVTLVGDSPWDAEAARFIGMRCLGVRCGGFGDERLLHAGADDVVDAPRDLIGRL